MYSLEAHAMKGAHRARVIPAATIRTAGFGVVAMLLVIVSPQMVSADQGFDHALSLYLEGDVTGAASAFEELWSSNPENAEAGYDLGLCLLDMGLADSAAKVLDRVAEEEKLNFVLRRDLLYNLGLARASAAKSMAQMNPGLAKTSYERAVDHFRDALAYDGQEAEFQTDAGYNIEAVWRLVEQLEERMQEQTSSAGSDSLAQQVQDLADEQAQLRNQTEAGGDSEDQAGQQEKLSERAEDLSEEMQKRGMKKPAQEMKDSQHAQEQAAEKLKEHDIQGATEHQDEAMEKLREALASLLQQGQEGEQEQDAAADAKEAAEELARLRREAEKAKEKKKEELQRRGLYRPPVTDKVEVERNW